ncbi:trypsin, alkaline C [Plutella xylostella]|uniref:trypsin, alkaline C n=1 Tax=Plutella xylostella TaxID=51655 RepID=UPI0020331365|nr:trypsin, alkaline C [Plutella xylostella]
MRSLILLALVGAALAVPEVQNRIVDGEETTIEQYRFMANLEFSWQGVVWTSNCGGAIITTNAVLTAAHCPYGDQVSQWRVRAGSSATASGGSIHQLSAIRIHPDYNRFQNDVAVLILSNLLTVSPQVGAARLAGASYILPENSVVTALGYGLLADAGDVSPSLKKIDVSISNQQACIDLYEELKVTEPHWPTIGQGNVCTASNANGGSACNGDGGAPLVSENDIIYALTSWGKNCNDDKYPIVNVLVPNYIDFIVGSV